MLNFQSAIDRTSRFIPDSLIPILVVLALSFLIGFEREERHRQGAGDYSFGGVRTFPLIGLCGYMAGRLSESSLILIASGLLGLSALLWLSYRKKLELSAAAGITSEVSALFTYLLGAVISQGVLWEGTALAVVALLLLELKTSLERLARKIPPLEILTFTRFLLITGVILPLLPNESLTEFGLNPFRLWLVVVAISGFSYLAYVLGLFLGASRGALLSAALGGLYSSTVTTVVLAKRSHEEKDSHLLAGGILVASGLMYFRLVALLYIFNGTLGRLLALPFLLLGFTACLAGWIWSGRGKRERSALHEIKHRNPLELPSAFQFAILFVIMAVLTKLVIEHGGSSGLYWLSFITGLTDIDPFVMSLTQSAGTSTPLVLAARGIVIASASNDLMKAAYATLWGRGQLRGQAATLLITLAAVTFLSLFLVP
jgi:uncharacterized membrane protein (DUF4010 family)